MGLTMLEDSVPLTTTPIKCMVDQLPVHSCQTVNEKKKTTKKKKQNKKQTNQQTLSFYSYIGFWEHEWYILGGHQF